MGLTINYQFKLDSASPDEAREKIIALRKVALELPFIEVGELVEIQGEECKFDKENVDDPNIFLKIRGLKPIEIAIDTFSAIEPTYLIAFDTIVGKGCETAAFGLAIHSTPDEVNDWIWTGFCKTQYASNPDYGGIENFIECHLTIVKMLEASEHLGIVSQVMDEGDYWETRNLDVLVSKVKQMNMLVAAVTGKLSDYFREKEQKKSYSPIFEYPNFEYLEAKGDRDITL
ncbi:hypothetical protein ACE1CD_10715 [Aerosakkonema sp. BLCC-F183]|uniref:hypothetical protein n=1 Tax=Aerosakkonema sp. BLCC-F183 TaxID=3342834 RepID=UPI0035B8314D